MKRTWIILGLALAIGAGAWWYFRPSPVTEVGTENATETETGTRTETETEAGTETETETESVPAQGETTAPPSPDALGLPQTAWSDLPQQDPPAEDEGPKFTGKLEAPAAETLRSEVAKDPHGTPPSLLLYAHRMADRMEAAFQGQVEADRLFAELEDCVRDSSDRVTIQVQVVCYTNASRLSKKYPGRFQDRLTDLKAAAPAIAKMVVDMGLEAME